jgi:hypothetical protein
MYIFVRIYGCFYGFGHCSIADNLAPFSLALEGWKGLVSFPYDTYLMGIDSRCWMKMDGEMGFMMRETL